MNLEELGQRIKTKYPEYQDYSDEEIGRRILRKYPQYNNYIKQPGALEEIGNFIVPVKTKLLTKGVKEIEDYDASLPSAQGDILKALQRSGLKTKKAGEVIFRSEGGLPVVPDILEEEAISRIGGTLGKYLLKNPKAKFNLIFHPQESIWKMIENKAIKAGSLPGGTIADKFGTYGKPNRKLYKGLAEPGTEGLNKLEKKLKNIIATQESSGKDPINLSYEDILDFRKGAYLSGKAAKGTTATPEQRLLQNVGKAYSEILKEDAGTGGLDKIFSILKSIEGKKKAATVTGGGIITYLLLSKLVNKLTSSRNDM